VEAVDNIAGVRRQAPNCRGQRDLVGADFQELGKFSQKNNAFLGIILIQFFCLKTCSYITA